MLAQIKGPDGKIIYSGERETDGKYTFSAHIDGRYEQVCFPPSVSQHLVSRRGVA